MIKDKVNFAKESRSKLIELTQNYFDSSDEEHDIKFNEFKKYYKLLFEDITISNNNKILYSQIVMDICINVSKNLIIKFIAQSIVKIYKKEINRDLLINNEYFIFRFLANKEIIKNILKKRNNLNYIILHYYNIISRWPEWKFLGKNEFFLVENINKLKKNINQEMNKDVYEYKNINKFTFESFMNSQDELMENKFIDLINNKRLFKIINNNIVIDDDFKNFLFLIFNLNVNENIKLNLTSNDENEIIKELENLIINVF